MEQRVGMEDLLRRIRREIRRRRAEFYGLRGAFWGGMAGLVVLLVKQGVGGTAPWVAGGLVLVGALAGLVYGAARRIDRGDTARVADRAFGLHDRVANSADSCSCGYCARSGRSRIKRFGYTGLVYPLMRR